MKPNEHAINPVNILFGRPWTLIRLSLDEGKEWSISSIR